MTDERKAALDGMARLLPHWEDSPVFEEDYSLALQLIVQCRQDYDRGGESPLPWLALMDLIEEHGRRSCIKVYIAVAYDLPSPS